MKYILLLVSLFSIQAQIIRFPNISEEAATVIANCQTEHPAHFFAQEGDWSNPNSPAQKADDYMVVKTSSTNGVRVLRTHITLADAGGMLGVPVFTDVVTGERFEPTVATQIDGHGGYNNTLPDGFVQGYFHVGSMTIDGDKINVLVAHWGDTYHPVVCLTWGKDATAFNLGNILDSFAVTWTKALTKTPTAVEMIFSKDFPNWDDGSYVVVHSQKEFDQIKIETTADFKLWSEVKLTPYLIVGQMTFYKVDSNKLGFFRTVE